MNQAFLDKLIKATERIPGGLASGKPDSMFNPMAIWAGTKVEKEHTGDTTVAKEIAKDHLTEDPLYYGKLKLMEQGALDSKVKKVKDPEKIKKAEFLQHLVVLNDLVILTHTYNDLFKSSSGEGSRGGKVIGHTKSGHPIYDSEQKDKKPDVEKPETKKPEEKPRDNKKDPNVKERKPHPGEEAWRLNNLPAVEKVKTYVPNDGTTPSPYDHDNLKAYKLLMREYLRSGVDFKGRITYDTKANKITLLANPEFTRSLMAKMIQHTKTSLPPPKR